MKKIPLKTANIKVRGSDDPVTMAYADAFFAMLESAPRAEGGVTYSEIRARMPIIDRIENALEKDAGFLLLEDAQYKKLVDLANKHHWGIVSHAIEELIEELNNAPDVEVEPTEDADVEE